jgi:hypothetical protein
MEDHLEAEDPRFHLHHIIPFSRAKEGFNVQKDINIKRVTKKLHKRWHALFNNKTPQEQLELWIEINAKVLDPDVRQKINAIAYIPQSRFYRQEITNGDRVHSKRKKYKKRNKRDGPTVLNIDQ